MEAAVLRVLGRQVLFLSRRWPSVRPGPLRIEVLAATVVGGLALTGMERQADAAAQALARAAEREVDSDGGIASRNPQALMEVLTHLGWAVTALSEAGRGAPPGVVAAIERIAPTLRALVHADGSLARFHGGDRGAPGRLDAALAQAARAISQAPTTITCCSNRNWLTSTTRRPRCCSPAVMSRIGRALARWQGGFRAAWCFPTP
jgi:uncharacterized heparinase superfamily protein